MRCKSLPALVILFIVGAGCAPNRHASPLSIPVPLVSALIDSRGSPVGAAPMYTIGRLPPGYPVALAPPGPAIIVGGVTIGDEMIAVFADSTRRLATVMEQVFGQHGFNRPPPTSASGFSSGSGPYGFFCGDGGTVSVASLAGSNDALARVTYRRTQGMDTCRGFLLPPPPDRLALPELKPPPNVRVVRAYGGGGGGDVNSSAEMSGADLIPSMILGHYAAQLVAAGWMAEAPAISPRVAAQYFMATDAAGVAWEGVLMASGGRTTLTLSLVMQRRAHR